MKKLTFLLILFCISCSKNNDYTNNEQENALYSRSESNIEMNPESYYGKPIANHVFLLAIDGWAANVYERANIPNIKKIAKEGCFTLSKRSIMPSSSAPNWASMFMGVGPEIHGYTQWGSSKPEVPSQITNHNGIFPTVYYLLNDQQPEKDVSVFYEWNGIQHLIDYNAVDYHKLTEYDNGDLSRQACEYIKNNKPNLMAVIWDGLDHEGHSSGWGSEKYMAKLEQIDSWIGEIIQAIKDKGLYEKSVFIITSDHGGINTSHGGITNEEMHTPFIISGKNILSGKEITTPMVQYDVAATIAYIFDIRRPRVWTGRPMTDVFTK